MSAVVGELAPDFSLTNQFGEPVSLSGLKGKPVVLGFLSHVILWHLHRGAV